MKKFNPISFYILCVEITIVIILYMIIAAPVFTLGALINIVKISFKKGMRDGFKIMDINNET